MLKVEDKKTVRLYEVEDYFKDGHIVIMNDSKSKRIYKLSKVQMRPNDVYAFVSFTGNSWANGSSQSIVYLIEEYEKDIIIFESKLEYVSWLSTKLQDNREYR